MSIPASRQKALDLIDLERERQIAKWGDQHHDMGTWMCILAEEVGEIAQSILQTDYQNVFG